MGLEDIFQELPFAKHIGIVVTEASDGYARGKLELKEIHSSTRSTIVSHGGVQFSLADTVGGAAVVSKAMAPCPTIDMRIDYLSPATKDLYAEGEVVRLGETTAVVDVSVWDIEETPIAEVRGVYKTGYLDDDSPWPGGKKRE